MVESPEQQHPKKAFGWAARDSSGVLSPFKFSRRETGKNDVMFKVLYCGICHTDLHMIKNEWGNSTYPLLPGHEIVGVVTEVGTKVEKFKVGDHVGVGYMAGSCQSCDSCSTNAENYCPKMIVTSGDKYHDGTPTYGGYSDIMVANEHFVVRIPNSLPLDGAAPLLCAGVKSIPSLTTFSSLQVKLAASQVKGEHVPSDIPRHQLTTFIRSIINKQDEPQPFYVLDLGVLVSLMQKWNRCLPNVLPFFAVKCNPEPALIAALATLGASFDCASKAEIEAILSHGVSPSRIVYANPCKSENHLRHAAEVGVNLATFDSIDELNKLKRCHPKCSLLLRIAVLNDTTSWRSFGTKFGALSEEVAPLLRHAHKLGLRVVGVSFHVGSKASESQVYRGAIAAARAAFDVADELKLPKMHVLDIGGGFKENPLFDEIAETLNDAIKEYFGDHQSESDLVVMAEPGRFFAETAFTLVANVMGKRVRGEKREYWITDGIYGSFNLPAFDKSCLTVSPLLLHTSDHHHHSVAIYSSTVFGPTCDSLDTVMADCKLPELKLNDYLVFHNMGAYTSSAGTNFNGFCISAIPTCLTFTNANN